MRRLSQQPLVAPPGRGRGDRHIGALAQDFGVPTEGAHQGKMTAMVESWDWSDAWVAKSIAEAAAEGPADLTDVIAHADVLNHAILLHGELEQAVRRLLGAGLVSQHGDKLAVSQAGEAVTAPAKGGLFSQVDGVARRLKSIPVAKAQWSLEPSKFDAAVDEYLDRAQGLR